MTQIELTDAEVDVILERFDATDPKLQRRIVARLIQDVASQKTNRQIVDECNVLAKEMYSAQGYHVADGFRFYESTHPRIRGVWNLAVIAYGFIAATDPNDALRDIDG